MRAPILLALAISLPAYAEDVVLTHQVRVLDPSGLPVEGQLEITIELYEEQAGGIPLWSETQMVTAEQGYTALRLGAASDNRLDSSIAGQARYAQVSVGGSPLGGRQRLSSVPLAARAASAGSVDGDVVVTDLQLQSESASTCASTEDYGKIRWNGDAFQGCRPGGWSNLLMGAPNDAATDGMTATPGLIGWFEGACPNGWSLKPEMAGRVVVGTASPTSGGDTVGQPLEDNALRTLSEVPLHSHSVSSANVTSSSTGSHTHSVNPPSTRSGNQTANHSHSVDPPNTSTNTTGNHSHGIATRQDDWNVSGGPPGGRPSWGTDNGPYAVRHNSQNAGNHAHTVNIGAFNSGGNSVSHQHDVDIPAFNSAAGGTHTHTVTVSGQTATQTGTPSVDVTMPYIHLVGCELD